MSTLYIASTARLPSIFARPDAVISITMAPQEISFIPYGAIIQTLPVAGTNIVLNFPDESQYPEHNTQHFGCTIGRVANRLKDAQISGLNGGKTYTLAANNGKNSLHGGPTGWGRRVWKGPEAVGVKSVPGVEGLEGGESVKFSLVSEDGDEGFPGEVHASVVYTAGTQKVEGKEVTVLAMEYEAELVGGAEETVINMTNHSYVPPLDCEYAHF
jgi:aldose 1-epimerase